MAECANCSFAASSNWIEGAIGNCGSIELIDPWVGPARPIVGANPMRVGARIAVRWEHPCTECDFILRLDDTKVITVQSAGITTNTHDLGAIPVGVHTIEIEATNGSPCPPPTVQPTGCAAT